MKNLLLALLFVTVVVSSVEAVEVLSYYGNPSEATSPNVYRDRNIAYANYAAKETEHRWKMKELALEKEILYATKELERDSVNVHSYNKNVSSSKSRSKSSVSIKNKK